MTTTESIRSWFLTCPAIKKILGFNIDYSGGSANECAIYSMPTNLNFTEDIVGNISFKGIQPLNFLFSLKAPYGDDATQNLENLKFFDDVKEWMYLQNTLKNFPVINEGEVRSLMPTQTEYVSQATADTATYMMRCELKYWRDN